MSTELHAPYTARNSERWQLKPSSPAGISLAARITREREERRKAAQAALAAVQIARHQERVEIERTGTPMERGMLMLDSQITNIREAHNMDALYQRDWTMRGMLEAARAFRALEPEEIERFRQMQRDAFDMRLVQLTVRLEK